MATMENAASSSTISRSRTTLNNNNNGQAYHYCERCDPSPSSSPHSAALPSPPDSPSLDPYIDADLDSLSSFPSVSSSVFFSSGTGSPHSQPRNQEHGHDTGLIIPSLTLPSALAQPTPYGQTLGEVSLMLVGPKGAGKTAIAEFLADSDDVVDVGDWEGVDGGRICRASTDWLEEHDPHGLERFEGATNISFLELDGFDTSENPGRVVERVLKHIQETFHDVRKQVDSSPSSPLLHSLLASSHSPLFTALIYVTATYLTEQDQEIISALSSAIPIIPFCTTSLSTFIVPPKLANFQPHSQIALRTGLFRSPQTVASLRTEAADRFMRWRETERVLEGTQHVVNNTGTLGAGRRRHTVTQHSGIGTEKENWNKPAWEAMLSEDVARRLKQTKTRAQTRAAPCGALKNSVLFSDAPCFAPSLDPLHFRSLFLLSASLFAPRMTLGTHNPPEKAAEKEMDSTHSTLRPTDAKREKRGNGWSAWRWSFALFCTGVGLGCILSVIA